MRLPIDENGMFEIVLACFLFPFHFYFVFQGPELLPFTSIGSLFVEFGFCLWSSVFMIYRHEDEYSRAGVSMAEFRWRIIGPNFWGPTTGTVRTTRTVSNPTAGLRACRPMSVKELSVIDGI
jgi:hypothetical protein